MVPRCSGSLAVLSQGKHQDRIAGDITREKARCAQTRTTRFRSHAHAHPSVFRTRWLQIGSARFLNAALLQHTARCRRRPLHAGTTHASGSPLEAAWRTVAHRVRHCHVKRRLRGRVDGPSGTVAAVGSAHARFLGRVTRGPWPATMPPFPLQLPVRTGGRNGGGSVVPFKTGPSD